MSSHCPSVTVYGVVQTQVKAPTVIRCLDKLDRPVRQLSQQFNGSYSQVDITYDRWGRVREVSEPHTHATVNPNGTTLMTDYDYVGRLQAVVRPDGTVEETDSVGLTTQKTVKGNGLGICLLRDATNMTPADCATTTSITRNALGQVIRSEDAADQVMTFEWDEQGNVITITDALNQVITYEYDELGRRTRADDPNQSTREWVYDVLGQLKQTHHYRKKRRRIIRRQISAWYSL